MRDQGLQGEPGGAGGGGGAERGVQDQAVEVGRVRASRDGGEVAERGGDRVADLGCQWGGGIVGDLAVGGGLGVLDWGEFGLDL